MKFRLLLILALGAISLSGCVANDPVVRTVRPADPVKKSTFDDLAPKPDTGGFEDPRSNARPARQ